jgi:uncharacterized protein YbjT (DUF2867 family)
MNPNKTALIAGSTGLVGKALLTLLLDSPVYDKVIAVGRKAPTITNPKLESLVVDFNAENSLQIPCHDVFCCLGTTIAVAGSQEKFREVDHDYPLALAQQTLATGASAFYMVSAMGADSGSKIFYNRVKGDTEKDIAGLGFQSTYFFRPSMLLGDRGAFRLGEKIGKVLMVGLDFLIPAKYKAVPAKQVAWCMLQEAQAPKMGVTTVENDAILAA